MKKEAILAVSAGVLAIALASTDLCTSVAMCRFVVLPSPAMAQNPPVRGQAPMVNASGTPSLDLDGVVDQMQTIPSDRRDESVDDKRPETLADVTEGDKVKEAFPKTGSLSRAIAGGYENKAIPGPWGEPDQQSNKVAPVTGSISKTGRNSWTMKIFNNSEDTSYSVNLEVIQYDVRGQKLKSDFYSYSLKPGEAAERPVTSYTNTVDAALNLTTWKKIGVTKKPAAATTPGVAAPGAGAAAPRGAGNSAVSGTRNY